VVTRQRRNVLAGLLVVVALLTTVLLSSVLSTTFFAITVAYVTYPLSVWLTDRGLSKRVAAAVATVAAFAAGVLVIVPLAIVVYLRRRELFAFFQQLPASVTVGLGELSYVVDIQSALVSLRRGIGAVAVDFAGETPIIALKAVLFAMIVYALLLRPEGPARVVYRTIPSTYHDVVNRLHEQLKSTLYAIYVLQAATAFGTFLMAWGLFALLGYRSAFALAVVAGVLQFVPVVGPSVVVLAVAAADLVGGDVGGALVVTILGLVLIAFLPDAVIRPRLASYTTGLPASLYFVGFTGGVLSLGLIGFIAGPVVVALLVEATGLLDAERHSHQTPLE
jgi:predicted PurR-regulated permease PerM